jgi:hypothetical protein
LAAATLLAAVQVLHPQSRRVGPPGRWRMFGPAAARPRSRLCRSRRQHATRGSLAFGGPPQAGFRAWLRVGQASARRHPATEWQPDHCRCYVRTPPLEDLSHAGTDSS